MKKRKLIIFTDLDGTLLDASTYSFEAALPALESIRSNNIPLVLCSSKTRPEIEHYRTQLKNNDPFISENGGGIFIPSEYFTFLTEIPGKKSGLADGYYVITLGAAYKDLRAGIRALQNEGFRITGFGDMEAGDISRLTALRVEEAEMAKDRDFDEPFIFDGDRQSLLRRIDEMGFTFTQGRFDHILGSSDKGKAVAILSGLYRRKYGAILTIALGDSLNDLPMLKAVDLPVLVQKPDGSYDLRIEIPKLVKAKGTGPEGWNSEILSILETGSAASYV
jgi:mannosyl-3-phosphoglycerate phosphatase family protein